MFKRGEIIQVGQAYNFDVVYERIYIGNTGKESCPFLCVALRSEQDFNDDKPFKTSKWRFARSNNIPYYVKKEKKKIGKSGLDLSDLGFKI